MGFVPDDWDGKSSKSAAELKDRWNLTGSDHSGSVNTEIPTHRCAGCSDFDAHIESCPVKTYRWCPECERVTRFRRLERLPE